MRVRLATSLVINAVIPLVLYLLLRPLFSDDDTLLAIAGAIPVARTVVVWATQRRVDWIGLYAALGFSIAVVVSVFSGGNTLLLELHEQLLMGTAGFVLLLSAIMNRPLLLPLLETFRPDAPKQSRNVGVYKRVGAMTAALGLVLLGNALAHLILALTLPTDAYLVVSRVVTFGLLGGLIALAGWARRRGKGQKSGDGKEKA